MRIEVKIGRLVLDGLNVSRDEAERIGAALEAELGRLLGEAGGAGFGDRGAALTSLTAPQVRIPTGASPAAIGAEIARSAWSGVADAAGHPGSTP